MHGTSFCLGPLPPVDRSHRGEEGHIRKCNFLSGMRSPGWEKRGAWVPRFAEKLGRQGGILEYDKVHYTNHLRLIRSSSRPPPIR